MDNGVKPVGLFRDYLKSRPDAVGICNIRLNRQDVFLRFSDGFVRRKYKIAGFLSAESTALPMPPYAPVSKTYFNFFSFVSKKLYHNGCSEANAERKMRNRAVFYFRIPVVCRVYSKFHASFFVVAMFQAESGLLILNKQILLNVSSQL